MTKDQKIPHQPVMLGEIVEAFSPVYSLSTSASPAPIHFDGTFGRGGHISGLLSRFPHLQIVSCDQDKEAIEYGLNYFRAEIETGQVSLYHCNFFEFSFPGVSIVDTALLDLGVSSPQLDEARRGFSFLHEGPLDMRMNQDSELTAAQVLMEMEEVELIKLFQIYGEVQRPHRVVRAIVHDRKEKVFSSTKDLAEMIARIDGWRKKGFHPATQYFMALRIYVNQELQILPGALEKIIARLKLNGRLAVLTFHSLEDRIVKNVFRNLQHLGRPLFKKVVVPSEDEQRVNPRSRSAKLRVFVRENGTS
jgi:16S rRNA (cytosine1402-N4)-methyltransferase